MPGSDEVVDELFARIISGIHLGEGAQFRVGTEHQIGAGAGPADFSAAAVQSFVNAFGCGRSPFRVHVEQVDKKVIVQRAGRAGEYTVACVAGIDVEYTQATNQHGHFRRSQCQQLRAVQQQCFGGRLDIGALVIAEAIGDRFQHGKGFDIGLCLRCIAATGREGHFYAVAAFARRVFNCCATGEHDQIRKRNFFAARLRAIEFLLQRRQRFQHRCQLRGLIHRPVFLRRQTNARAVGTAAFVGSAECGGRGPRCANQLRR